MADRWRRSDCPSDVWAAPENGCLLDDGRTDFLVGSEHHLGGLQLTACVYGLKPDSKYGGKWGLDSANFLKRAMNWNLSAHSTVPSSASHIFWWEIVKYKNTDCLKDSEQNVYFILLDVFKRYIKIFHSLLTTWRYVLYKLAITITINV